MTSEGSMEERAKNNPWMRRFFTLWTGQAVSLLGSSLVQWALFFWLAITTGSPLVLAIAAAMGLLPQVLLAPFAGAYVDRLNRKRVMVLADLFTALSTLLLMMFFASGSIELWYVLVIMFLRSAMQAFHWPAMQASTTLMVPEDHLARISGFNQSILGLSSILGPAIGAALYVAFPMYLVLAIDVVTAAIAIVTLLAIRIPEIRIEAQRAKASVIGELIEAYRYLRSWKGVFLMLAMFSIVNFLITPAITFFDLLTLYHFGQGAYGAALIDAMAGMGMIAGGLVLGIWGGGRRKIITCLGALALSGWGILLIGILPPDGFVIAVVVTLLIGMTLAMVNGIMMAVIQRGVRADMQGRVFALIGSMAGGMSPLGLVLSGPIAGMFGIQSWFIAGGLFMIVVAGAAFIAPTIMHIEDHAAEAVIVEP